MGWINMLKNLILYILRNTIFLFFADITILKFSNGKVNL